MSKLGEISVNGKTVSVFRPPHNEPDFPWVDVEELAKAFLPRQEARRIVKMTHSFGDGKRARSSLALPGTGHMRPHGAATFQRSRWVER